MTIDFLPGDAETRLREFPDDIFHACVTSPPYYGLRKYSDNDPEIGHELTPGEYAARLTAAMREVRRTLRPDGSLWLVLGDSYARNGGTDKNVSASALAGNTRKTIDIRGDRKQKIPNSLKEKDLIGIPWLTAFALRADGWYLREAIVQRKASCMPESVRDRSTIQHEYVFHLAKSPNYYHDSFAISEPAQSDHESGNGFKREERESYKDKNGARGDDKQWAGVGDLRNSRSVWDINPEPFEGQMCLCCGTYHSGRDYRRLYFDVNDLQKRRFCWCGTNDQWLSHFAVFPSRLVARCLRASTSTDGCCTRCGAQTERIVAKTAPSDAWKAASGADASGGYTGTSRDGAAGTGAQDASATKARILAGMARKETIGWKAGCACDAPCTARPLVLDPFSGAGTTALVSARLGIDCINIDLNPNYIRLAQGRLADPLAKCLDTDGSRLLHKGP